MSIEIGSYEAKTKLPELLRGVQAGNRYTITLRGEAIADLVPAECNKSTDAIAAVEQMHQFMMSAPRHKDRRAGIKELINEGRA